MSGKGSRFLIMLEILVGLGFLVLSQKLTEGFQAKQQGTAGDWAGTIALALIGFACFLAAFLTHRKSQKKQEDEEMKE